MSKKMYPQWIEKHGVWQFFLSYHILVRNGRIIHACDREHNVCWEAHSI